jgi:hypothetical protein
MDLDKLQRVFARNKDKDAMKQDREDPRQHHLKQVIVPVAGKCYYSDCDICTDH